MSKNTTVPDNRGIVLIKLIFSCGTLHPVYKANDPQVTQQTFQ